MATHQAFTPEQRGVDEFCIQYSACDTYSAAPMEHRLAPLTRAALATWVTVLSAASGAAWADQAKPSPGHALAQRQGCLGCHAAQTQLLGPAYTAVAERYRDQKDGAAEVARHIRAGSSGRWGAVPMPPQTQLSEADAGRLAKWILSGAK